MFRVTFYITVFVMVATFVAPSANAAAAADPRVCRDVNTNVTLPARSCARNDATLYFRRYMQQRFQSKYIYQGALTCSTTKDILNYRCDFWSHGEKGIALVSLGTKATGWRHGVRFLSFVCLVERPGCP